MVVKHILSNTCYTYLFSLIADGIHSRMGKGFFMIHSLHCAHNPFISLSIFFYTILYFYHYMIIKCVLLNKFYTHYTSICEQNHEHYCFTIPRDIYVLAALKTLEGTTTVPSSLAAPSRKPFSVNDLATRKYKMRFSQYTNSRNVANPAIFALSGRFFLRNVSKKTGGGSHWIR